MKVQIREGVFETNSSSMHSLVIRSKRLLKQMEETNIYFTQEEVEKERLVYKGKIFGWYAKYPEDEMRDWYFGRAPFRVLSSFGDKWKYAYATYQNWEYGKKQYKDEEGNHDSPEVEKLDEIMRKYLPGIPIYHPKEFGTDECFLARWLEKYKIDLEEFLTNKQYVVICDGDEYCIFNQYLEAGFTKKGAFKTTAEPKYWED